MRGSGAKGLHQVPCWLKLLACWAPLGGPCTASQSSCWMSALANLGPYTFVGSAISHLPFNTMGLGICCQRSVCDSWTKLGMATHGHTSLRMLPLQLAAPHSACFLQCELHKAEEAFMADVQQHLRRTMRAGSPPATVCQMLPTCLWLRACCSVCLCLCVYTHVLCKRKGQGVTALWPCRCVCAPVDCRCVPTCTQSYPR